jgi:hypothetical protein
MKRITVLGLAVAAAGAVAALAFFARAGWNAELETTVAAPPTVISALLGTHGGWVQLEKVLHRDDRSFSAEPVAGVDRGAGTVVSWTGADGARTLTLTAVEPGRVAYTIAVKDAPGDIEGAITYQAEGARTRLTWAEEGPLPGGVWGSLTSPPDATRIEAAHARKLEALTTILEGHAQEAAILEALSNPTP